MRRRRLFLAHFTFRSGEVEMPFHQTLHAADFREAEQTIVRYLQGFYTQPEELGYLSYAFDRGAFAIDCDEIEPCAPERIIRHLEVR